MQLSRHTGIGWSGGGGGGSGTRGRTDLDEAEQRPPGRPLLCLPERAVCAARAARSPHKSGRVESGKSSIACLHVSAFLAMVSKTG